MQLLGSVETFLTYLQPSGPQSRAGGLAAGEAFKVHAVPSPPAAIPGIMEHLGGHRAELVCFKSARPTLCGSFWEFTLKSEREEAGAA